MNRRSFLKKVAAAAVIAPAVPAIASTRQIVFEGDSLSTAYHYGGTQFGPTYFAAGPIDWPATRAMLFQQGFISRETYMEAEGLGGYPDG